MMMARTPSEPLRAPEASQARDLQLFRSDECGIIFCKGSEGR
jgi:hypothetical protein